MIIKKALNAYCGVGGNRKKWPSDWHVTAVDIREDVCAAYKALYPNDTIICGDAHKYIQDHYKEFDLIWSSPPCQSHSGMRFNLGVKAKGFAAVMPDMTLYAEIVFLQTHTTPEQKWVVENVNPYYKPLIDAPLIQRHRYWANFDIKQVDFKSDKLRTAQIPDLQEHHGIDLSEFKIKGKRQVLRNCVHPDMGLHVLECAYPDRGA